MSPRKSKPTHGGKRTGAGRRAKPPGETLDAMLRVSRADLDRWREVATRHGYGSVQAMLTLAVHELDRADTGGGIVALASLGTDILEAVEEYRGRGGS